MKATKYTVNIQIETLSMDTIVGQLSEVIENITRETNSGSIMKSDGDQVIWYTETKPVEF